jgi:predicted MPP superfamily phosphohydrolase
LVRHVEIPLPNLPAGFDNLKIVQISDIHAGPIIGRKYVENVVRIANSLKPDLIVLTGDFVDGTVGDLKDELSSLATLATPLGTFYVTGNHEYYWGASEWTETFSTFGIRVLTNEHEIIRRNGDAIILAGVTDYSAYRMMPGEASDPGKALKGSPAGLTRILLAHQPASYKLAHKAGFDLQLSGHTHAGQYFPFCLFIGLFQRYYKGLNRFENMWVYVNSGTGYWGPPLRTGVPSEITQITLRKSSDVR